MPTSLLERLTRAFAQAGVGLECSPSAEHTCLMKKPTAQHIILANRMLQQSPCFCIIDSVLWTSEAPSCRCTFLLMQGH